MTSQSHINQIDSSKGVNNFTQHDPIKEKLRQVNKNKLPKGANARKSNSQIEICLKTHHLLIENSFSNNSLYCVHLMINGTARFLPFLINKYIYIEHNSKCLTKSHSKTDCLAKIILFQTKKISLSIKWFRLG